MSNLTFTAAGYTVELISVVCDTVTDEQIWTYEVSGQSQGAGQEISNWALQVETCDGIVEISDITQNGTQGPPGGGAGNCLGTGAGSCVTSTVNNQIQWDGFDDNDLPLEFMFTLSPCVECEDVQVAIKTGNDCNCGEILGPSLLCMEGICEPTRGLII